MIEYTLVRAKRKSIAIYVKDGVVTVKAPLKTDTKIIETFVHSKQVWIERKLREGTARRAVYADVLAGKSFLYLGMRLSVVPSSRKTFALQDGKLSAPQMYLENDTVQLNENITQALKRFYRRLANSYLAERLQEVSEAVGLPYTRFCLTNARGKWGSCDSYNRIRLNWHLILLPKNLIDYVIMHELVHTVEHNHSQKFWQRVAQLYPSYKEAIVCLKDVGILIELYA